MILQKKLQLTADNAELHSYCLNQEHCSVQPKPLGVVWNTDGTVIYTGKEANVYCRIYQGYCSKMTARRL